jgi:hypothetical protein
MTELHTEGPNHVLDTAPGTGAVGLPLAEVTRHFRRAVFIASGVGVAGLILTAIVGDIDVGVLFCVGLGLGGINGAAVQLSAGRYAMRAEPDKRRFAMGVLVRLAIITVIAFGFALIFRPEGLAVIFGLAFFQLLMLAAASGSMIRTLRSERPGA